MHAATEPAWALAIEHTALGEAMRGGVLLYPLVETGHILGFATLVGSILLLDLRLMGGGGAFDRRLCSGSRFRWRRAGCCSRS